MAQPFSATVEEWTRKVEGAIEAIFKESVQELVEQADALLTQMVYESPPSPNYNRTGFLRASVTASNTSMPLANRPEGVPQAGYLAEIDVVIAETDIGGTIYIGWTAEYSGYVHFGANGTIPKPWVDLVAQRWQGIVAAKTAELRSRLGL